MAFGLSAAAVGAIGAIGGGLISAYGSNQAADTQAQAAQQASDQQLQMFNTINSQQAPWRQAGQTALGQLGQLTAPDGSAMHQFNASDLNSNLAPNYQFQLDQGLDAVKNMANSAGGLIGGNALKGINDYAQNYAGNAYQQAYNNYNNNQTNIFNRLSSIAGLGQTANQTTANAGQNAATASGNYLTSGAAASAAGTMGSTNAITGGLNSGIGWNYLNSMNGQNQGQP